MCPFTTIIYESVATIIIDSFKWIYTCLFYLIVVGYPISVSDQVLNNATLTNKLIILSLDLNNSYKNLVNISISLFIAFSKKVNIFITLTACFKVYRSNKKSNNSTFARLLYFIFSHYIFFLQNIKNKNAFTLTYTLELQILVK